MEEDRKLIQNKHCNFTIRLTSGSNYFRNVKIISINSNYMQ